MIDGKPGFLAILRVNLRVVVALCVLGCGWVFWQLTSPLNWGAAVIAVVSGLAGLSLVISSVTEVVGMVRRYRKMRAFAAQGGKTRGDPMARDEDLRDRGMLR